MAINRISLTDVDQDVDSGASSGELGDAAAGAPEDATSLFWPPPLIGEFIRSADVVPEYLLENLMPADSNILMSGRAKLAFKSWMSDAVAIVLASGTPFGPLVPVNKGGVPVLSLAAEGGRAQTKNRKLWLEAGLGINVQNLKNFYYSHRAPILLDDPAWVKRIKLFVKEREVKFLVIDTLVMFSRCDENNVKEMTKVIRAINEFREQGTTVMFVHHLRKGGKDNQGKKFEDDPDDEIRGTSALAGFYDQHWALRQRSSWMEQAKVNTLILRSKDDEERRFEVGWQISKKQGRALFSMSEITEARTQEQQADELVAILSGGEPATKRRIEEMMGIQDAQGLIDFMVQQGTLELDGRNYRLVTGKAPTEDSDGKAHGKVDAGQREHFE